MNRKLTATLSITFALGLMSCGDMSRPVEVLPGTGQVGEASRPIYNGSVANQPFHGAVVSLHRLASGSVYVSPFCSGTLIKSDVVLTAAHCLTTVKGKKVKVTAPSAVAVYVGNQPALDILSHLYLVQEVKVHSAYNDRSITNDIALIRLQNAVTEPVTPVPYLPASLGFTSADIGASLNFAGFGETETGSSGVKLQMDLPLGGLGCSVSGCPSAGDAATQISYAQPLTVGGPCSGDSGGPAFISRNGTTYVGGITSYGDSNCTIYGVSTRTDAFDAWISAFTNPPPPPDCSADGTCNPLCEAGADPDCTSQCKASRESCSSGSECCSGSCHPKKKTCR